MPAPAEPRPDVGINAPSVRSDVDDTVATTAAYSPDTPAATGFGPPAAAGEVGVLGPYRVVKELGKGGMGAVYAAVDVRLDRRLALKVMLPQFAADANAKERFLREARAAAKITHDNVVTVYEADERQGVPYIAMQYLEGYPLDEYLKKKGNPTIQQVLRIAAETAAGLAAAHKIGLVHRDIKPGNLWLEAPNGRVKVLDFGLAKPVDAEFELTKSGAVVGTPAYMSPEQARGEKVDSRTDLFSLGAVMYRLCAGKLPFHGPTTMAVLMSLGTEEPPPVRAVNPAVPEPLAALIHQLLSKRADARPQSAVEVVKRVRAVAEELAVPRALPAELSTSQPQMMQPQVMYAVMPVTAAPAANPFADLDASVTELASRESNAESTTAPKPVQKKPAGKGMWVVAGLAVALAALVVSGVIIIIKNKDGTETKIEVPDGATVTVKDKGGKTLAQVGPGKNPPAVADTSADRVAAEWVLTQGGAVRVNDENVDIRAAADLPKAKFTVTRVSLRDRKVTDDGLPNLKALKGLTQLDIFNTATTDAGLVHLKELKSLTQIGLSGTQVTDAGLIDLKELKNLMILELSATQVTDAGLIHLKELKNLLELQLFGTRVTDAGLAHLKELKGLTVLNLQKTKVTAKGLEALRAALPACKIEHDGSTIEPTAAADPDRTAAEWAIAQGGFVRVKGADKEITAATDLPKDRFTLTFVVVNPKVTDAGLANLKELKSLTRLDVVGTKVTDAGLANLKELKSLTRLDLRGTQVTDAGLAHLKELKGLMDLNLSDTKVSGAGLAHLKELKSLTRLDLNNTPVTDAGLAHLKEVKWLREIYLSNTKVTDAGLAYLKEIKSLMHLSLANTPVTDAGLAHLKELKSLTYLELSGTPVTDAGLEHLKEIKSLRVLALQKTSVTAKGLEALAAALPACRINHDGGAIEPKK